VHVSFTCQCQREGKTYTSTLLIETLAFGVRGDMTSVKAIKAATANATVVKKPKTFWARTTVECIVPLSN
jgi:hypothetical protein